MWLKITIFAVLAYTEVFAYIQVYDKNGLLQNKQNSNYNNNLDERNLNMPELEDDYEQNSEDFNIQIAPEGAEELVTHVFLENKRSFGNNLNERFVDKNSGRDKKNVMECTVKKVVREFDEQQFGYATLPKKYSEYECVPISTGRYLPPFVQLQEHEVCLAHHCESVEKKMYYLRKNSEASCWSVANIVVKAGCECAAHRKYSVHSQH